jgi:GNAT superfamily N-acetyltransferase
MSTSVARATELDARAIAALRNAVSQHQTETHGRGHWSSSVTERGVATAIRTSHVLIVRDAEVVVATLRLATKKPWAIDRSYFAGVRRPLYLTDMAVEPSRQRQGVGRSLVETAKAVARAWPADAIRLDAYDAEAAGAGPFYAKCGFRQVGRKAYRGVPLLYFELLL